MTVPDYQSLMLPVLLQSSRGEVKIGDVIRGIGEQLALTSDDLAKRVPSGKQGLFENRVHWAKFFLSKALLIEATRHGYFKITARGKQALSTNPTKIDSNFLSQFEEFRFFKGNSTQPTTQDSQSTTQDSQSTEPHIASQTETPDVIMRVSHKQIEESLAQDLLDRIRTAPPDFFERLIINLLLSMSYGGSSGDAGRALGRSGDDGVDGVIDQDALGLDRVYVQAKRYKLGNNIGSGAIRDFFGSLDHHKAAKGLFVTTSTFSPSAKETAKALSKRIVLIDGDQLGMLLIRYNVGCRVEDTLHIKKIDEDFFQ